MRPHSGVFLSVIFFICSCASSRTIDLRAEHEQSSEIIFLRESGSPTLLMIDNTRITFNRVRITRDSTYGYRYGQADTVFSTRLLKEVRYKNAAKGMLLGFLIGLSPGVIIYSTAGFEKKDEDKRKTEGIWLGAIGALVAVGFSHDAAPTDTIVFKKLPVKQNTDDTDQTD